MNRDPVLDASRACEKDNTPSQGSTAPQDFELTEAGRVFLAEARAVLARADAAALSKFGSLKRGTLSIQASQTVADHWLPRHLVAFRHAYPQINIRLAIGNTAQVAAAVEWHSRTRLR